MIDKEELNHYIKTFERLEEIDDIIILGSAGGVRRITFKDEE